MPGVSARLSSLRVVRQRAGSSFAPLGAPRPERFVDTRTRGLELARLQGFDADTAIELPVSFRDIDRFQHVNNKARRRLPWSSVAHSVQVTFEWIENSRIALLLALKDAVPEELYRSLMDASDLGVILGSTSARFRVPSLSLR
jgi:hypothetical protein